MRTRFMQSTVLVVDDESDVVDLIRYKLRGAGFAVLEANDGLTALRAGARTPARPHRARPDAARDDRRGGLPPTQGRRGHRRDPRPHAHGQGPALRAHRGAGNRRGRLPAQAVQPARTRPARRGGAAPRARGRKTRRPGEDRRFRHRPGRVRDHARRPQAGTDDHRVQAALPAAGTPGPRAVARVAARRRSGATRARWTRARSIPTSAACARNSGAHAGRIETLRGEGYRFTTAAASAVAT